GRGGDGEAGGEGQGRGRRRTPRALQVDAVLRRPLPPEAARPDAGRRQGGVTIPGERRRCLLVPTLRVGTSAATLRVEDRDLREDVAPGPKTRRRASQDRCPRRAWAPGVRG